MEKIKKILGQASLIIGILIICICLLRGLPYEKENEPLGIVEQTRLQIEQYIEDGKYDEAFFLANSNRYFKEMSYDILKLKEYNVKSMEEYEKIFQEEVKKETEKRKEIEFLQRQQEQQQQ